MANEDDDRLVEPLAAPATLWRARRLRCTDDDDDDDDDVRRHGDVACFAVEMDDE